MNFKLKTLLVLSGAALLSVPALRAQHSSAGARASLGARPAAYARGGAYANTRSFHGGRYGHVGYYGHGGHHYGRYYYLGGIPYFYPFFDYGFGYPYGYGGFYGGGFGGPYGGTAEDGAYEGRVSSDRDREGNGNREEGKQSGPSLPSAVQRQLAKRGYYKGSVDGQFGPASRDALSRFQKSQDLKPTGRIDEDTLDALGFTDQH